MQIVITKIFIIISGYVAAQRDLWILGDKFINDIFQALPDLHNSLREAKHPIPYMYDYYSITYLTEHQPTYNNNNTLARIVNTLAKGLNEQPRVPRFILVIPDIDILRFINHFGFGVSQIIGKCLNCLIKNIDIIIESCKDDLRCRKPGALHSSEPKLVWMKIFEQPNMKENQFCHVQEKFNNILENILSTKKNHYIMDISLHISFPANFFPRSSILNTRGKDVFWLETDRMLEEFDYNKNLMIPTVKEEHQYKPSEQVQPLM